MNDGNITLDGNDNNAVRWSHEGRPERKPRQPDTAYELIIYAVPSHSTYFSILLLYTTHVDIKFLPDFDQSWPTAPIATFGGNSTSTSRNWFWPIVIRCFETKITDGVHVTRFRPIAIDYFNSDLHISRFHSHSSSGAVGNAHCENNERCKHIDAALVYDQHIHSLETITFTFTLTCCIYILIVQLVVENKGIRRAQKLPFA